MRNNIIETVIGAVVIVGAIVFLSFAYIKTNTNVPSNRYILKANFQSVDGIFEGSDIKIAGIKVGNVGKMKLDNATYIAELTLHINSEIGIPQDSTAAIVSENLIGNKYIDIIPGASNKTLKSAELIEYTQSTLKLENLINKFFFSNNGNQNL